MAETRGVSREPVEILEPHLRDFEIRYAFVEPSAEVLSALASFETSSDGERLAVTELITRLRAGDTFDMLLRF